MTNRTRSRSLTARYSVQMAFYHICTCGMFSFAASFLLDRGFNAAGTGVILALASLLSCLLQPAVASFADRSTRVSLPQLIAGFTVLCALCLLALHFFPLSPLLFAALFLSAELLLDAMQSLLNALSVYFNTHGRPIDYGVGRGLGSLAFAAGSVGIGAAMRRFGAESMLLLVLASLCGYLAVTLRFPRAEQDPALSGAARALQAEACSLPEFFRRYRLFCLSLGGVLFLAGFHAMTENYFITLMQSLGGDSRHVGVALAVATVVEVPVFVFFSRIRRRMGTALLLRLAGLTFLLKSVSLLLAQSILAVYAAELLQATSYGFLIPAGVLYAEERTAPQDMVKGQALFTAAYALGCSCGNFLGGQLVTAGGIRLLLQAGIGLAAAGTAILFATVRARSD